MKADAAPAPESAAKAGRTNRSSWVPKAKAMTAEETAVITVMTRRRMINPRLHHLLSRTSSRLNSRSSSSSVIRLDGAAGRSRHTRPSLNLPFGNCSWGGSGSCTLPPGAAAPGCRLALGDHRRPRPCGLREHRKGRSNKEFPVSALAEAIYSVELLQEIGRVGHFSPRFVPLNHWNCGHGHWRPSSPFQRELSV